MEIEVGMNLTDSGYRGETHADYQLVQAWCEQHCGEFGRDWYRLGRDPMTGLLHSKVPDVYYFRDAKMLTAFVLIWG